LSGVQLQIDIDDQATSLLEDALANIRDQINAGLEEAGNEIVIYAQQIVPVRTGRLRDSITYTVADGTLTIMATAPYAKYVEFGTRRMQAEPYIRPAIDAYLYGITDPLQREVCAGFKNKEHRHHVKVMKL
jgi:HK97 gp10 family phage protein